MNYLIKIKRSGKYHYSNSTVMIGIDEIRKESGYKIEYFITDLQKATKLFKELTMDNRDEEVSIIKMTNLKPYVEYEVVRYRKGKEK